MIFRRSFFWLIFIVGNFWGNCFLGAMHNGEVDSIEYSKMFVPITTVKEDLGLIDIDGEVFDFTEDESSIPLEDWPKHLLAQKLFIAVENNDCVFLTQLLKYGVEPWYYDSALYTPFHYAASWGRYECLETLLQSLEPHKRREALNVEGGENRERLLMLAILAGCSQVVISSPQETENCQKTIRVLLNAVDESERVQYVTGNKARFFSKDSESVLSFAVRAGVFPIVETLISLIPENDRYQCLTTRHTQEYSLLHIAVDSKNYDIAELLITSISDETERKKIINAKTGGGDTALHIAAGKNDKDMVILLLQQGADPLIRDICEQTAAEVTRNDAIKHMLTSAH